LKNILSRNSADREGSPSADSRYHPGSQLFMPGFSRLFENYFFPEPRPKLHITPPPHSCLKKINSFSQDFLPIS
jgi:hypothetical protein